MKRKQKIFKIVSIFIVIIGIALLGTSLRNIYLSFTNDNFLRYPSISPNYNFYIDKQINEKVNPQVYNLVSEIFKTLSFIFGGLFLIVLSFVLKQRNISTIYLLIFLIFSLTLSVSSSIYSIKYKNLTTLRINEINNYLNLRFSSLKVGMDTNQVIEKIGFPFEKKRSDLNEIEKWLYITHIFENKYTSNKIQLIIVFKKGKIEKFEHPISFISY